MGWALRRGRNSRRAGAAGRTRPRPRSSDHRVRCTPPRTSRRGSAARAPQIVQPTARSLPAAPPPTTAPSVPNPELRLGWASPTAMHEPRAHRARAAHRTPSACHGAPPKAPRAPGATPPTRRTGSDRSARAAARIQTHGRCGARPTDTWPIRAEYALKALAVAGCARRARCTACAPAGEGRRATRQSTRKPPCRKARRAARPAAPREHCHARAAHRRPQWSSSGPRPPLAIARCTQERAPH
mmetsp:Transcript_26420/g.85355  ORF Transcript_26420/g.85355 Transcript_26420/m.85355 type:complete len:242 (-) Transcript_26420:3-728(-)